MEAKILFKRFMLIYASQETLTDISTTATTDGFSKKTLLNSEPVLGQVSRDDCLLIQSYHTFTTVIPFFVNNVNTDTT